MDSLKSMLGGQKKRKLTKGGVPVGSQLSTTPPPPDSGEPSTQAGNLLTNAPSEPIPYPFNAQLRLNAAMKLREKKFRNFTVVTPMYPDLDDFRSHLSIHRELRNYFVTNGLGFVYGENPGVFEKVVREFAYSFEPRWGGVEINEYHVRVVKEWKFQLGGREFTLGEEDLRSALSLEDRGACLPPSRNLLNELWRTMTKSVKDFRAGGAATQIKVPLWKFVHRLIATCFYLRKDGGRFVNLEDLELMACMYGGVEFDPLSLITRTLQEPQLPSFRGHYLSGGHFITMIARFVGFSMNPTKALPLVTLGMGEMVNRGLVKKVKAHDSYTYRLVGEEDDTTAASPMHSPHPEQGEPSMTHGGSDGYDEVLRRIDSLTTSTHELADWQNNMGVWQADMATWHGDMMRGLYTNLGYSGYRSPPPHNFHHATAQGVPSAHDNFGDNEGMDADFERENEDEEETSNDDDDDDSGGYEEEEEAEENTDSDQPPTVDYQMEYRTKRRHD